MCLSADGVWCLIPEICITWSLLLIASTSNYNCTRATTTPATQQRQPEQCVVSVTVNNNAYGLIGGLFAVRHGQQLGAVTSNCLLVGKSGLGVQCDG